MKVSGMTVRDLIKYMIKFSCVEKILEKCDTQSIKGYVFERLFDIVIKFGFCDKFSNQDYNHILGNLNTGKPKIMKHYNLYLNYKIISGKSTGCSDITLQNKKDKSYVFISSKYPKDNQELEKQKSIKYYDIQDIIAMATKNKNIYLNYIIFLAVYNKQKVLSKARSADDSSKYITDSIIEENILDLTDLNKYFQKFKESILRNINNDWTSLYLDEKESLKLRFHQELMASKTLDLIIKSHRAFLLACKCRSGKTYITGGFFIKYYEHFKYLNAIIITPAPSETIPQFTDDLFMKYKDFKDIIIHHLDGSNSINNMKLGKNNIFVLSKQLLQKYTGDNTISNIKDLNIDIITFDENHFGGTTYLSKEIINSYSNKNTIKLYLTATYNKPLKEWNIEPECQMYWNIEDEQNCKSILKDQSNISKLEEKHGKEYVQNTIKHFTDQSIEINDIFKIYQSMPDLHIITNMFDSDRYNLIKKNLNAENKIGFCFDTLFGLNKLKNKFSYEKEVKLILRYISGSFKERDGENTIYPRINKICSELNTRIPFTHIWFLPSNNINEISKLLEICIQDDIILQKYRVMCVNRKNKLLAKDVRDEIIREETIAKNLGYSGLIILAGNMLNLGISLNLCDLVILLNNTLSADKILQQMYRCMTEALNKKIGFVVDMNISRVLHTCISYSINNKNMSIDNKIKYIIENHLINIDVDMLWNKKINSNLIIKKLMDIWRDDPINNFKILLRKLEEDYELFDNYTQKLLNKTFSKCVKGDKISLELVMKDKNDELIQMPSGREVIKYDEISSEYNISDDINKRVEQRISFTEDVLPYIIPLACILTVKDKNMDFVKMLNDIKENPELLEIFDDQCFIWWNKKNLIDIIKNIIDKYFNKNSNTYNISMQFKMSLQSIIDNPKELLLLINDCLKPKEIEKKKFGEVFTPIDFINNYMLKDIEDYWLDKYDENIWTNDKLTWYDPAVGMGNYSIAIYYKLYENLKDKIPDDMMRKKHIIEEQLYMGELNKKNCFIIKQIFNINNFYNLNLYEGDTLQIDINNIFNIDKFDIIIGNPPYNEEMTSIGAKPLYHKFIEYYLNKCKILSFIVPSRWFVGGKGLSNFRSMMLKRTDIVFIKHFDNASKIFGNLVNIKGGVNYFLIDHMHNGLCLYNNKLTQLNKYDVIVNNDYYNIIDKLSKYKSLTDIYLGRYFGIESNDKKLVDNNDLLKCYVSQQKGFIKYIDKKFIKKDYNFYKIITTRSSYEANSGFGNIFIGTPDEIHTGSYISFKINNNKEAESLLSYLKCRLPNFMLSLRKVSQDISMDTCKWIPLVPLNKQWTDDEVFQYFELSDNDIDLVKKTKIIGYK
jgi:hypothetical protein